MMIILLLIVLFYGSIALGKVAEIDEYAVITAIGLDKAEDDIVELSLLTFVPIVAQNFAEQYEVVKASGETVAEAIDFAGLYLGRKVGLSHVEMVVINEQFFEEDLSTEIDYLRRDTNLSLSTTIICTDAKAVDFLMTVKDFNTSSSVKADELLQYNEKYVYASESTFDTFYKGIFSPTKSEIVSFITLTSEEGDGISISASTSESSEGGDTGSGQKKKILNDGQAVLCKKGKKVAKLSKEEMKCLNLLKGNFNTGSITIEDFSDDTFQNARLTFELFDNKLNMQVRFENGVPVVYMNSKIFIKLTEVDTDDILVENVEFKSLSDKAIKALEGKVKSLMKQGMDILRENKTDIIDLYTTLNNSNHKKMQEFLNRLENKDEFLSYVVFKVSPQIYSN